MAAFQFQFQRLLELKENEKGQAQVEMAEAVKKQEEMEKNVLKAQQKLSVLHNELAAVQLKGISIFELRRLEGHIETLKEKLVTEQRKLHNSSLQVDQKQAELVTKVKETKTWITIRDQQKQTFIEEQSKKEQIEMDELTSVRMFYQATGSKG
ncbi:flagellar export protein FliJ [Pseudalkalibacillus caeni]|uniref:flagellar export protein FliJ n=1 Tax=Exobacillus caeni TaxID=2574798 RepID=UPI001FE98846|nr:flagellar export protein FliJ [Pseudalkalibacillus caeni]